MIIKRILWIGLFLLALTACGGGGGSTPASVPQLVASPSGSTTASPSATPTVSASPVALDHVQLVLANTSLPAGTPAVVMLAVNGYDSNNNLIAGSSGYVDTSGRPVTITLSKTDSVAGGAGATSLASTLVTASGSVALSYNGKAMYQTSITATASSTLHGTIGGTTLTINPTIVQEFSVAPIAEPDSITTGPDHNLWLVGETPPTSGVIDAGAIGRLTTAGALNVYPLTTHDAYPTDIISAPDGNLWFTEYYGQGIGSISVSGAINEYQFPASIGYGYASGIVVGPDGNFWVTQANGNAVVVESPAAAVLARYTEPGSCYPGRIVVGPDNALWFTNASCAFLTRVSTSGQVTQFPLPSGVSAGNGITVGPDNNLWFAALNSGSYIVKATVAGVMTTYPVSSAGGSIVVGPDGNLWFTEPYSGKIGRISTSGNVAEFPIAAAQANSAPNLQLTGITVGPDNNIWFAEWSASKVGTLVY